MYRTTGQPIPGTVHGLYSYPTYTIDDTLCGWDEGICWEQWGASVATVYEEMIDLDAILLRMRWLCGGGHYAFREQMVDRLAQGQAQTLLLKLEGV